MGRWFVVILATLALCGIVSYFWPETASTAFLIKGHGITWMMLIGVGSLYVGHRLTSK